MDNREKLRDRCLTAFRAGVAASDPVIATRRALDDGAVPHPAPDGQLYMAAIGKAAVGMARPAMAALAPARTLVVTNDGNDVPLPGAEVMVAGHPVPDHRGATAAMTLEAMAQDLTRDDVLMVLVSGGASAMLPAPRPGLALADEVAVNRLALASGADIHDTNILRQAVSRLKGGGLARMAAPARVVALILSDVVGDDPAVVASGPTAAPIADREAARAVAWRLGVWNDLPAPVRALLSTPETPAPPVRADNRVIGGNAASVAAMAAATPGARRHAVPLTGDVGAAADAVLSHLDGPGGVVLFGGETTVRLRGQGRGGRNQELALRVAMKGAARGAPSPSCRAGRMGATARRRPPAGWSTTPPAPGS